MRPTKHRSGSFGAFAFAAALSGCTSIPTEHFYTVSSESAVPEADMRSQRIAVSPVVIPRLIDRPQFVVRTGGHEIAVLENHRWAEPLSVDLTRALVNDLHRAGPAFDIVAADVPHSGKPALVLDVVIADMVSTPGASTSFEASWALHDRQRNCVNEGRLKAAVPTRAGYEAVPAAYADAMALIAEAIVRSMPQRGGQPCQVSASSRPGTAKYE